MHKLKPITDNKKKPLNNIKALLTTLSRYPQRCGQKNNEVKVNNKALHISTHSINTTSYLIRINCLCK